MSKNIKFVLNGCDISFIAEAPEDITLKQLLAQTDKIVPLWCACGICSLEYNNIREDIPAEIFIDYGGISLANDDVNCVLKEEE